MLFLVGSSPSSLCTSNSRLFLVLLPAPFHPFWKFSNKVLSSAFYLYNLKLLKYQVINVFLQLLTFLVLSSQAFS